MISLEIDDYLISEFKLSECKKFERSCIQNYIGASQSLKNKYSNLNLLVGVPG